MLLYYNDIIVIVDCVDICVVVSSKPLLWYTQFSFLVSLILIAALHFVMCYI